MTSSRTLTARWIFPASGPPLPNGVITLNGDRIVSLQTRGDRSPDEDCGNAAIVPGLVNAHTHLDLSGAQGQIPPTGPTHFTDWLRSVIAFRRTRTVEQVQEDIRAGLAQCLRTGTTLVGDIAFNGVSWDALAASQTRAVVFYELIGLSEQRAEAARSAGWNWYQAHPQTPTCKPAFSPHAPYSARESLMFGCAEEQRTIAIHLAESPGELELINSRSGPFVPFLHQLGVWDESGLLRSLSWLFTRTRGSARSLYIHCNYLPPDNARYFDNSMSLVYCPRTHAAFGHPPHPFREFLARGVRVCLGTDSLASNPDLDVLAEARFVRRNDPSVPAEQLLRMATLSGAEALGWATECGSLEAGKSADLVVVPLPDRDGEPYQLLFEDFPGVRKTMFRGQWREI